MGILDSVLEVFDAIGSWIPTAVSNLVPMFYTAGESGAGNLTFLGVLAVAGLAFSVIFLVSFCRLPGFRVICCNNRV